MVTHVRFRGVKSSHSCVLKAPAARKWGYFIGRFGTTWGDYVKALAVEANLQGEIGDDERLRQVFAEIFVQELGVQSSSISGTLCAKDTGEPLAGTEVVARYATETGALVLATTLPAPRGRSPSPVSMQATTSYMSKDLSRTPMSLSGFAENVAGLEVRVSPIPVEPTLDPLHQDESQPRLSVDASGVTHKGMEAGRRGLARHLRRHVLGQVRYQSRA